VLPVSDPRSNRNDQIRHAVEALGRSQDRLKVFKAIYRGKRAIKTVSAIAKVTKLLKIRVLQEAAKLSGNGIVHAVKVGGETGYRKDSFYATNRSSILRLVGNPTKLAKLPTKTHPRVQGATKTVVIKGVGRQAKTKEIFIDEIDSFKAVRKIKPAAIAGYIPINEKQFKLGIQKLLGEKGKFTDWGGEKGDLLTTRLYLGGKRIAAAFAFKGRGMNGVLTPAKMGKNGDQIQRLFESAAKIFILQYWRGIDERVREQVQAFAMLTSLRLGEKILFCLIDGGDTARLIQAYPKQLSAASKQNGRS
jgi:hypothetical protein